LKFEFDRFLPVSDQTRPVYQNRSAAVSSFPSVKKTLILCRPGPKWGGRVESCGLAGVGGRAGLSQHISSNFQIELSPPSGIGQILGAPSKSDFENSIPIFTQHINDTKTKNYPQKN